MYGNDDNASEGPRGTFEIYRAEADSLYKQGEYRKAIESYTIVSMKFQVHDHHVHNHIHNLCRHHSPSHQP